MAAHEQRHSGAVKLTVSVAFVANIIATAVAAGSERPRPENACIAYDLHILTLLEDHGLAGDFPAEVLSDAAFRMLEARRACFQGNTTRALDIYDSIYLDRVRASPFYRVLLR